MFAGRAVLVTDPAELSAFWAAHGRDDPAPEGDTSDLFRIEVSEVVAVHIELPNMVIESWHEGAGYARRTRA